MSPELTEFELLRIVMQIVRICNNLRSPQELHAAGCAKSLASRLDTDRVFQFNENYSYLRRAWDNPQSRTGHKEALND
jgi:hypothetical protein